MDLGCSFRYCYVCRENLPCLDRYLKLVAQAAKTTCFCWRLREIPAWQNRRVAAKIAAKKIWVPGRFFPKYSSLATLDTK